MSGKRSDSRSRQRRAARLFPHSKPAPGIPACPREDGGFRHRTAAPPGVHEKRPKHIPTKPSASPFVKGEFYLFSPSSRFITWLATIVKAADCGTANASSGLDSPTDRSFFASSGWATK